MPGGGLVITQEQGVTVASFRARSLLEGPTIDEVGTSLYELVDDKACRKIILDFREVNFLASAMIGVLVALDNKAKGIKGKIILSGLRPSLMKVFRITSLDKRMHFAKDTAKAMEMFEATAGG